MRPNNSPLEYLAAFAIAFATGLLSAVGLAAYFVRTRRHSDRDHYKRTKPEPGCPASNLTEGSTLK